MADHIGENAASRGVDGPSANAPEDDLRRPGGAAAKAGVPSATDQSRNRGPVHLDILSRLDGIDLMSNISIIIENVPEGAQLSTGKNNWDNTWSLTPIHLTKLEFTPPDSGEDEYTLTVRVISIDTDGYGVATTEALFDVTVPVNGDGAVQAPARDLPSMVDTAIEVPKDKAERLLADMEEKWRAEEQRRLVEAESKWKAETEAKWRTTIQSRLTEIEAKRLASVDKGDTEVEAKKRAEEEKRQAIEQVKREAAEEKRRAVDEARREAEEEKRRAVEEATRLTSRSPLDDDGDTTG